MDQRERYTDDAETMRLALEALQTRIWTSLPCVVQSFPAASGLGPMLLDAQPTIAGSYLNAQGETVILQMPLLVDVPVSFPGGGGVTFTFPVKPGDECLVTFSARCIDAWWQLGAAAAPNPGRVPPDDRMHNLSDGVAHVGVRSNPRAYAVDLQNACIITDDGQAYFKLNPSTHAISALAPGGMNLNGVTIDKNGNMNAPGNVVSQKTVTGTTDVVTGNNTSLNNHLTSGVSTGTGTSGKPVAGT